MKFDFLNDYSSKKSVPQTNPILNAHHNSSIPLNSIPIINQNNPQQNVLKVESFSNQMIQLP